MQFHYRFTWVAYRSDLLVCWWEDLEFGIRIIESLMLLGNATTESLRGVPLKLIRTARIEDYPHWPGTLIEMREDLSLQPWQDWGDGWRRSGEALRDYNLLRDGPPTALMPDPPPWSDVQAAWDPVHRSKRLARVEAALLQADPGPRRDGESVDVFYRRVAANYRAYAAAFDFPTSTLAERSGVSKSLAGKWVHEARRRGFLPPTTKGRASS